jgi:hypothetical protein
MNVQAKGWSFRPMKEHTRHHIDGTEVIEKIEKEIRQKSGSSKH